MTRYWITSMNTPGAAVSQNRHELSQPSLSFQHHGLYTHKHSLTHTYTPVVIPVFKQKNWLWSCLPWKSLSLTMHSHFLSCHYSWALIVSLQWMLLFRTEGVCFNLHSNLWVVVSGNLFWFNVHERAEERWKTAANQMFVCSGVNDIETLNECGL